METAGTNNIYYFDGSDFSPFSYRDMDSLAENSIVERSPTSWDPLVINCCR